MHILHVVQGYTPAIGGTERLIQQVSENLVARHQDQVTVYTTTAYNCELFWRDDQPELPAGTEIINGVTVRRFPVFNKLNTLRFWLAGSAYKLRLPFNDRLRALHNGPLIPRMPQIIADAGADVIVASSFPLLHMHYALRGGRRADTPVVLCGGIHTADDYGFNRPMIYKAIRQANAYIAYTPFEKNYLVQERAIPPELVSVTGVGVDVEPFAGGDGQDLRRRLGWGNAPVVAYIGQQVPHKGVDMLMQAMEQIWQEVPDACVIIAGSETTYSAFIKSWADGLPAALRARVALINNFAEEEKPDIYAASDIVVYPSGHESFGIVFLEAWAARKPVVGARIGAIPTVVADGKDGLLTEYRQTADFTRAIRALISNPDLRQQMGNAGYQKVCQQYTWDIVTDKFRAVYIKAKEGL